MNGYNAERAIKRRLWSSVRVDRRPASVPCKVQAARQAAMRMFGAPAFEAPVLFLCRKDGLEEQEIMQKVQKTSVSDCLLVTLRGRNRKAKPRVTHVWRGCI